MIDKVAYLGQGFYQSRPCIGFNQATFLPTCHIGWILKNVARMAFQKSSCMEHSYFLVSY